MTYYIYKNSKLPVDLKQPTNEQPTTHTILAAMMMMNTEAKTTTRFFMPSSSSHDDTKVSSSGFSAGGNNDNYKIGQNNNSNNTSAGLFDSVTSTPWVLEGLQACEQNMDIGSDIPRISESSLEFDSLLGQGGFCSVFRVVQQNHPGDGESSSSTLPQGGDDENDDEDHHKQTEYAMKCLNPTKFADDDCSFVLAAADLAMEASLLSTLGHHENIVRLRGISSFGFTQSFTTAGSNGFFLLLSVLRPESLADLLSQWRRDKNCKRVGGFRRKLQRSLSSNNFVSSTSRRSPTRGEAAKQLQSSSVQDLLSKSLRSPTRGDTPTGRRLLSGGSLHDTTSSRTNPPSWGLGGSLKRSQPYVQDQLSQSLRSSSSHGVSRSSQDQLLSRSLRGTSSTQSTTSRSSRSMSSSCSSSSRDVSPVPPSSAKNKKLPLPPLKERLEAVAAGVVKGLSYLHSQGIVFRDLKPSNIGFDEKNGTVKIFDFGLARRISDCGPSEVAGSYRYMAPEMMMMMMKAEEDNANGEEVAPSGSSSSTGIEEDESPTKRKKDLVLALDVYSLGVLLWELATIQRPYSLFLDDSMMTTSRRSSSSNTPAVEPSQTFQQKVMKEGWRHSVDEIPHQGLGRLIQDCWNSDAKSRPTMSQTQQSFMKMLEQESSEFEIPEGIDSIKGRSSRSSKQHHQGRGGGSKSPPPPSSRRRRFSRSPPKNGIRAFRTSTRSTYSSTNSPEEEKPAQHNPLGASLLLGFGRKPLALSIPKRSVSEGGVSSATASSSTTTTIMGRLVFKRTKSKRFGRSLSDCTGDGGDSNALPAATTTPATTCVAQSVTRSNIGNRGSSASTDRLQLPKPTTTVCRPTSGLRRCVSDVSSNSTASLSWGIANSSFSSTVGNSSADELSKNNNLDLSPNTATTDSPFSKSLRQRISLGTEGLSLAELSSSFSSIDYEC